MDLLYWIGTLMERLTCWMESVVAKLSDEDPAAKSNVRPEDAIEGSVWDEDGNLVGIPTVRHEYVVKGLNRDVQRARVWLAEEGHRHTVDDPVAVEFLASKAADVSLCAEALVKSSSFLRLSVGFVDEARRQQGCDTPVSGHWRLEAKWWKVAAAHCMGAFAVALALYEEALEAAERPWAHRYWINIDEERLGEMYRSTRGLLHEIKDARYDRAYPGCWATEKEEILLEDYLDTTLRMLDDLVYEYFERFLNPARTGVAEIPDLPPLGTAGRC